MTKILSRVGPRGQTVIPKPVRDELGLKPGDPIYFSTHGGHAHVEPADSRATWEEFFNAFDKTNLPHDHDFDAIFEESYDE